MDREELLKFCRYHKGGETDGGFASYEEKWIQDTLNNQTAPYLEEYIAYGLTDFEKFDGVPVTLKALLFNRFTHWSTYWTKEDFRKYYIEYRDGIPRYKNH